MGELVDPPASEAGLFLGSKPSPKAITNDVPVPCEDRVLHIALQMGHPNQVDIHGGKSGVLT